jgi:transposase
MERFLVSQRDLQRYKVIGMALSGRCTVREAAVLLGLSTRQVKRLKRRVREKGVRGVLHQNSGKASPRRLPQELRDRVIDLAREKYRGLNDTHMWEKLVEDEGLRFSRVSLRRILRGARIPSPRKRRPAKHRRRRERRPQEGFMLLLDGSPHDWLEGRGPYMSLVAAIDDATNIVPWASFEEKEDSAAYLRLLKEIVTRHGIPLSVYTDRHSAFVVSNKKWTIEEELAGRQFPTHVGRALGELGIELILANSPQAKGRVERLFGTLQDRLISELRLAGAKNREEANGVLQNIFMPQYNQSFIKKAAKAQKAYRPLPKKLDLDRILSFAYPATVQNDNTVRINNQIIDIPPGTHNRSYARAKVIAHQLLNGNWRIYYEDKMLVEITPDNLDKQLKTLDRTRADSKKHRTWVKMASKPKSKRGDTFTEQLR